MTAAQKPARNPEELAARVVELAARAGGSGCEAEVTLASTNLALTRFANSFIHQNVEDVATSVRLRLHIEGRTASASTTVISDEGLAHLVDRTLAAARLLPVDPGWAGLTPLSPRTGTGHYDPLTAEAPPAARAAVVRAFVDAAGEAAGNTAGGARGVVTAGFCRTTSLQAAYANTLGHAVTGRSSGATVDGIARHSTGADGVARACAVSLADIDGAALGRRASAKAQAGADPVDVTPGQYEVVLEPNAVADILLFQSIYGFNARSVIEGSSFVRLSEQQFDPMITVVDDPLASDTSGVPFDAEGTPKRPLDLVRDGVCRSLTHDRRTARELAATTTGHAIPGGERWGAIASNVRLATGSVADPVAGMQRGLVVSDFWYTRVLDPKRLVVTGLTRNGVWLVEDGELVRAVRNVRFTQSYPEALAPGAVLAIGTVTEAVPAPWGDSAIVAPALQLAQWNVTGGATG